jgi:protocatechuate 3,4-dioxygenase beta subunit
MRHRPNNLNLLVRRHALAALVSLPAAATAQVPGAAVARPPTPRQSLGPFYPRTPEERPRETDADLVVVQAERVLSRGVPLYLTGRVLDRSGTPVPAARIEIWQCDANAVYHHPAGGAEAERDPNFQGYGQTLTESDGAFHFRTIRPVAYPGRTPHIHVRVEARGRATLATQLYLAGEAGNARDFLFRQLSVEERAQLTLAMRPTESAHPLAQATAVSAAVDLVLA